MHSRLKVFLARAARKSATFSARSFQRSPRVALIADYKTVADVVGESLWFQHQSEHFGGTSVATPSSSSPTMNTNAITKTTQSLLQQWMSLLDVVRNVLTLYWYL